MKESVDDNFNFDENDEKFSKRIQNTRYEQFLIFPLCFQKTCITDT